MAVVDEELVCLSSEPDMEGFFSFLAERSLRLFPNFTAFTCASQPRFASPTRHSLVCYCSSAKDARCVR